MKRRLMVGVLLMAVAATCSAGTMKTPPLQLFGVTLHGADRTTLRKALKANGMAPLRVDDGYWADEYDPHRVLLGATQFDVFYVAATNRFAWAEYTFQSFMDDQQVAKIIALVRSKYGAPSRMSGDMGLGPVDARWNFPGGMQIEVDRGWPDTTTYLDYVDPAAKHAVDAEMAAQDAADLKAKATKQRNAF